MKKIEAIIKPFKLEAVKEALAEVGITGMTASEVKGCGRCKGPTEHFRGQEYRPGFVPKIKLEMVVPEPIAERAVAAVVRAARTGCVSDGKVFVTTILDVLRIRTTEAGRVAV